MNIRKNKKFINAQKVALYAILILSLTGWLIQSPKFSLLDLNYLLIVFQCAGLVYGYSRHRQITKVQLLITGMLLIISIGMSLLIWGWKTYTAVPLVFLPVMTFHLGMIYPEIKSWYRHYGYFSLKILYLLALLVGFLEILIIVKVLKVEIPSIYLALFNLGGWGLIGLVMGGGWMILYYKSKRVLIRRQLQYLLSGLIISIILGAGIYWWGLIEWRWIIFIPGLYFVYLATSPGHQSNPTRSILTKGLSAALTFLISISLTIVPVKLFFLPILVIFLQGILFASLVIFLYPRIETFFDRLLFGPRKTRVKGVVDFIDEISQYTEFSRLTAQFTETIRKFTDTRYCLLLIKTGDNFVIQSHAGEISIPSQFSLNCNQSQGMINYLRSVARLVIIDEEDYNIGFREVSIEDKVYLSKIDAGWIFPLYLGKTLWGVVLGAKGNKPIDKWYQDQLVKLSSLSVPLMNSLKENQLRLQTQVELQQSENQRYLITKIEEINKSISFSHFKFKTDSLRGFHPGNAANFIQGSDYNFMGGNIHWNDDRDRIIEILRADNLLEDSYDFSDFSPRELFEKKNLKLTGYSLLAGDKRGFKYWSTDQGGCFGIYPGKVEKIENRWHQFDKQGIKLILFSNEVYYLKNIRHQKLTDDIIYSWLMEIDKQNQQQLLIDQIMEFLVKFTENSIVERDVKILTVSTCQN